MNPNEFIIYLEDKACCVAAGASSKHLIYQDPYRGFCSSIPRYGKIKRKLLVKICKDLGVQFPQNQD